MTIVHSYGKCQLAVNALLSELLIEQYCPEVYFMIMAAQCSQLYLNCVCGKYCDCNNEQSVSWVPFLGVRTFNSNTEAAGTGSYPGPSLLIVYLCTMSPAKFCITAHDFLPGRWGLAWCDTQTHVIVFGLSCGLAVSCVCETFATMHSYWCIHMFQNDRHTRNFHLACFTLQYLSNL